MDTLVSNKFQLMKDQIIKDRKISIGKELARSSSSGVPCGATFGVICDIFLSTSEKIIRALLNIYSNVQQETGENIIITKETEIRKETVKLVEELNDEAITEIGKYADRLNIPSPRQIHNFYPELSKKTGVWVDILIETEKRKKTGGNKFSTNEAFVIMQIGNKEMDNIWKDVFVPAIRENNLEPKRVDKHDEGRFLGSQIADFIKQAKITIADLTNERPNCYLEVGYTMGLDKFNNLILTAREDHNPDSPNYKDKKVHFDISGYNIIWWDNKNLDSFKADLSKKIKGRLNVIEKATKQWEIEQQINYPVLINRIQRGIYTLAEIYNAGEDDIADFSANIEYEHKDGQKFSQKIDKFILNDEDPLFARPVDIKILRKGERIHMPDFPTNNVNGKVKIIIEGKTVKNGMSMNKYFEI